MSSNNMAPVIIKKIKKGGGDGHHGGAWKVAYADFVTAMMAFFLLMWLLNATTEQQRSGIADFFTPTIPLAVTSGGGDGAFGGDDVLSENTLPQSGRGATDQNATEQHQARGELGLDDEGADTDPMEEVFETINEELRGKGGESAVMDNALEHIVTKVTEEGLVIEIFSTEEEPIFRPGTNEPNQVLRDAVALVVEAMKLVENPIAIGGHIPAQPIVVLNKRPWELSQDQATVARQIFEETGVSPQRIARVSGHADREIIEEDPLSIRNNRIEIILLRDLENL